MRDTNGVLPETPFWQTYSGTFAGMFGWDDFDALFATLGASCGDWYVFDPEHEAPTAPSGDFANALAEARACVEQVRSRSYCGAVFADDPAAPGFVKVFDPYRMGAVCGSSGERVMPRWIFSRLVPTSLPLKPEEPAKKGLFARLAG